MSTRIEFTELTPSGRVPLSEVTLQLTPQDNVAVAKVALRPGITLISKGEAGPHIPVRQFIPNGHKIALQDLAPGAPVLRYGQIIGFADQPIVAGDHVHTHNVVVKPVAHDDARSMSTVEQVEYVPEAQRRTFLGFGRDNGRVGTRNYVAIIATVNCSAHVCREIASYFTPERLKAYPNVDGVIPIVHTMGCTDRVGTPNYIVLQRTLAGIAHHLNVAGFVLVGLGCE